MKQKQLMKVIAAVVLGFSGTLVTQADTAGARKVFTDNVSSVIGVRGLLKMEVSMNGQPSRDRERPVASNGVVVGEGLVAVAYRTIKPDLAATLGNRPDVKIESDLSDLKLVDSSGEEYDAKLVLHDEDLGLAFVAVDPNGDTAQDFKIKVVDVSKDVEIQHLDELVGIGRLSEKMRSAGRVSMGSVSAIVEHPRVLYFVQGIGMSNPVFTQTGEFVGLTVALKDTGITPVLMPAKYLRKVLAQAKVKQAELPQAE